MRNKIAIIVIIIVAWYYTRKVQAAKALMVRYLLPQNIRISNGALKFVEPIVITNPTGTPIVLQRYYIQIWIEGSLLGTAFGAIETTLQAASDTTILSNGVIPIDAIITAIPSLWHAGKTLDCRFVGNIFAELLTIPVDTTIKLPIPTF